MAVSAFDRCRCSHPRFSQHHHQTVFGYRLNVPHRRNPPRYRGAARRSLPSRSRHTRERSRLRRECAQCTDPRLLPSLVTMRLRRIHQRLFKLLRQLHALSVVQVTRDFSKPDNSEISCKQTIAWTSSACVSPLFALGASVCTIPQFAIHISKFQPSSRPDHLKSIARAAIPVRSGHASDHMKLLGPNP